MMKNSDGAERRGGLVRRSPPLRSLVALFLLLTAPLLFAQAHSSDGYQAGFRVSDHGSYKLVTVTRPWPHATRRFRYLLVRRGSPVPSGYAGVPVIRVPIRSIVALSETYLGEIAELGELSTLTGVESLSYVYDPAIRRRIREGKITTVGAGQTLNTERLIAMKPDVIMTSAYGGSDELVRKLQAVGLPVVVNGDWASPSPLGRAKWIEFIGLFYGKEATAVAHFERVTKEYHRLTALAHGAKSRPTVFANAPWHGTWEMPGGESYMAQLLRDAGARYLWAGNRSTGSLSLGFESVFARAANADFWIDPGDWKSLAQGRRADPRFAQFKAFKEGHVYNNIAKTTAEGGNAYWETGPANPQLVLRDLIRIFHPGLLPGRKLTYFVRLE